MCSVTGTVTRNSGGHDRARPGVESTRLPEIKHHIVTIFVVTISCMLGSRVHELSALSRVFGRMLNAQPATHSHSL